MSPSRVSVILLTLATTLFFGCGKIDELRQRYTPKTPREDYVRGLEETGLMGTVMGKAWTSVAEAALETPVNQGLPYREQGYTDPALPSAVGFSIPLTRGQRLVAEVHMLAPDSGRIFLDLFHLMDGVGLGLRRVALSDSTQTLTFDATRTGSYILRMQPELLAGGRYSLSIRQTSSIIFPVSGRDTGNIGSWFGDPRDAGRREHHGVDIFARRGTPVIAVSDGYVTRVRTGGLGGKTIWVRKTGTGHNMYYAHMDEQLVREGTRVAAGDTLGLVGNTGNARTTPPHLHFGIYQNGPVDPLPFLHEPRDRPPAITARTDRAGTWMRTIDEISVLSAPSRRADSVRRVDQYTSVRILAAAGRYYRIRLPDGTIGYSQDSALESSDSPIGERVLASAGIIQSFPAGGAGLIESEQAGSSVIVHGRFESFLHVETASGRMGWLLDS